MGDKRELGYVILGSGGYMGINGLDAMQTLLPLLKSAGIQGKLMCVAETNKGRRAKIDEHYPVKQKVLIFPELTETLLHLELLLKQNNAPYPIIFYDATPASFHYDNLTLLHQFYQDHNNCPWYYLGEKPIFLDTGAIEHVKNQLPDFNFFCEFIETENPVYIEVREYLAEQKDLQIEKMLFWRAGSSGIKKAICADRPGVQGGALYDKAPHDLSISVGWLGGPSRVQSARVERAEIHDLIVSPEYYFAAGKPTCFLSASNNSLSFQEINAVMNAPLDRPVDLPADGLFSMDVEWHIQGQSPIPAHYLFSWIGVSETGQERTFIKKLTECGIIKSEWLLNQRVEGLNDEETNSHCLQARASGRPRPHARIEEARIGIVEYNQAGQRFRLICNFLSTKDKKNPLPRFARIYKQQGPGEYTLEEKLYTGTATNYDEVKQQDLANVFRQVTDYCLATPKPNALVTGRKSVLLIHETIIAAHNQARAQWRVNSATADIETYFHRLLESTFNKRIWDGTERRMMERKGAAT